MDLQLHRSVSFRFVRNVSDGHSEPRDIRFPRVFYVSLPSRPGDPKVLKASVGSTGVLPVPLYFTVGRPGFGVRTKSDTVPEVVQHVEGRHDGSTETVTHSYDKVEKKDF